jgi:hypothetical protein
MLNAAAATKIQVDESYTNQPREIPEKLMVVHDPLTTYIQYVPNLLMSHLQ